MKVDGARGPHYESLAIRSFENFLAAALAPKKAKIFSIYAVRGAGFGTRVPHVGHVQSFGSAQNDSIASRN